MSSQPPRLFDRARLMAHRERASARFASHDFLHRRVAEDITFRLETITRSFEHGAVIGPGAALVEEALTPSCDVGRLDVIDTMAAPEMTPMEEEMLPLRKDHLDLIISFMSLHHVNDLPGVLARFKKALKPDGLMIAALPGETTLKAMREALYAAETALSGGVSARIIPFGAVRDLGGLLQGAGFALPVADVVSVPVTWRDPLRLFSDLRGMGETSVLASKSRPLTRDILAMTLARLQQHTEEQGHTTAFEIVFLTGWAPHESQQKPLKPGSATHSLEDAVKGE